MLLFKKKAVLRKLKKNGYIIAALFLANFLN
ncbi:hypothetical protein PRO82_001124 [Candidatus Protochlamydia amoebophila]|nr:hypothetical protein [Candidatus Protochlamydia amoebophila]